MSECPDSLLEPVPSCRAAVGRRSPGGILEAFRRRSKSDSKSSSTMDVRTPNSTSRRGGGFMSTFKNMHMPWRSASVDNSHHAQNQQQQLHQHQYSTSAREAGFHALASHLSPMSHSPVSSPHITTDPYATYTYGQDPRYGRSGNVTRTVMDIFKRSDSMHNNNFKRSNSLFHDKTGIGSSGGSGAAINDDHMVFVKFFKHYRCYDLIPVSAKLIVLDTQLIVKKAFHALVSNGVRAAPLWDASAHGFTGMLTITDFINILRTYYKTPSLKMEEIEEQKLEKWRNVLQGNQKPFCNIDPYASLFDAIKTLIQEKVHRLPVIDPETGNVLYILTHKRILKFLFLYYYDLPLPHNLDKPIRDLNLGTYDNIATATMNTPLIDALHAFNERRVSALPVIDETGKVIDVYAKFDVINLAAEKTYNNLDITIKKALEYRNSFFEGVVKCTLDESLSQVVERIVKAEVHRIVVVDNQDHVIGMISLSDILSFLVLRPVGMERKESIAIQQHTLLEESEDGVTDDDDFNPDEQQASDKDRSTDSPVAADFSPESSSEFSRSPQIPQVTVTSIQEKSASSSPQRKQCIERQDEEDEDEAEPEEAKPVDCSENTASRRILTSPVDIVG